MDEFDNKPKIPMSIMIILGTISSIVVGQIFNFCCIIKNWFSLYNYELLDKYGTTPDYISLWYSCVVIAVCLVILSVLTYFMENEKTNVLYILAGIFILAVFIQIFCENDGGILERSWLSCITTVMIMFLVFGLIYAITIIGVIAFLPMMHALEKKRETEIYKSIIFMTGGGIVVTVINHIMLYMICSSLYATFG